MSYLNAFGVNIDLGLVNKAELCGAPHKLRILISPEHLGQRRGSVSYTFLIK